MVNTVVLSCALESGNILRTFHHTDNAFVSVVITAYGTDLTFSKILAAFAAVNIFLCTDESIGKVLNRGLVHGHYMVGQSLSGFHAYSRKGSKLFRKYHQRKSIMICHYLLEKAGEGNSSCDLAHFGLSCSLNVVYSLVNSADDKVLEHIDILGVNDLRLDCE